MSKYVDQIHPSAAVTFQSSSENIDTACNQFQRHDASVKDNEGGTNRSAVVCDFYAKGWCVKGNSCTFLPFKDSYSWEPSTLFQPSFPLTQSLLSRAISIRDSREQSQQMEFLECTEQSLGGDYNVYNNITNEQNYKNGLVPVEIGTRLTGPESVDMARRQPNVKISKDIAEVPRFMSLFRTALIEKVKEVLLPTWLEVEGKLSKKAHNKIVKKTVDKIMGKIKQFPSTLQSADLFSSSLEQNIAHLVKYYMNKYGKQ